MERTEGCGVTLDAKSVHTFNIFYNFVFLHVYISICLYFSIFLKILTHMTTIVILLNVFVVGGPG